MNLLEKHKKDYSNFMAIKKKKQTKPLHHTLREFLFSLTYWGSWSRALLFFVIVTLMLSLSLSGVASELTSSSQHVWYTALGITSALVYSIVFFAYDAAYVTLARRAPLPHKLDRLILFVAEVLAVAAIFSGWMVYEQDVNMTSVYLTLFGALLVLPVRAVLGVVGKGR